MDNYKSELKRVIFSLSSLTKDENNISNVLLFRDYLNRLFKWKENFGDFSKFIKTKEAHNLFLNIDTDWTHNLETLDQFKSKLIPYGIVLHGGRYLDDIFTYLYFHWNLNLDKTEIKNSSLLHPYKPVMKIIERCPEVYFYSGQFQIGNFTYNNKEKYHHYVLPSLDDSFLDFIDNKLNYLGTSGIPNQEETNRLWEEFQKLEQNG